MDNLLSRFMKKHDVDEKPFIIAVLQLMVLNFVFSRRDTSSLALSWFFWLDMNYPKVEKIVREITMVFEETYGGEWERWIEDFKYNMVICNVTKSQDALQKLSFVSQSKDKKWSSMCDAKKTMRVRV